VIQKFTTTTTTVLTAIFWVKSKKVTKNIQLMAQNQCASFCMQSMKITFLFH